MSEPIIRTLRKSDYPALIDVVRRMWYPEYDEKTGLLAAETDWENCLARATDSSPRTVWHARPARLPRNSTGNQSR